MLEQLTVATPGLSNDHVAMSKYNIIYHNIILLNTIGFPIFGNLLIPASRGMKEAENVFLTHSHLGVKVLVYRGSDLVFVPKSFCVHVSFVSKCFYPLVPPSNFFSGICIKCSFSFLNHTLFTQTTKYLMYLVTYMYLSTVALLQDPELLEQLVETANVET